MAPQDTSILHQYHKFSGQSSEVDFEAAEQLLQHSRKGRERNGDSVPGLAVEPETSEEISAPSDAQEPGEAPLENGKEKGDSHLQDRHAESQYPPINSQPPLGQICRYAQSHAFEVCCHCLL